MSCWPASRERSDFKRAQDFLESSRIVMNIAIETMRCISEPGIDRAGQQAGVLTTVILNARFLNKNLDSAFAKFNDWEQVLAQQPDRINSLGCLLINIRKNFDTAIAHTEDIMLWLQDDEALIALYSNA